RDDAPPLRRSRHIAAVHCVNSHRYYSDVYPRGYWPQIYAAIVTLRAALPHCSIHYGSDVIDDEIAPEVTDEMLAALWEHWLGPHGTAYGPWL
ncbi:MAG: hypothetical protein ACRDUY_07790, partial [Nitriliruptorales bacterium]